MRRISIIFLILIIPVLLISQDMMDDRSGLQSYADSLDVYEQLINDHYDNIAEGPGQILLDYLGYGRNILKAIEEYSGDQELIYIIKPRIKARIDRMDSLRSGIFMDLGTYGFENGLIAREDVAYAPVAELAQLELYIDLKARILLAERKYFELDDLSKGSPLEIFLNGVFGFTRTDLFDLRGPYYGIKPWEINARLEPIGFMKETNLTGILFSLGTIYNFFPEITEGGGTMFVNETAASSHLKRIGIKLGAGGRLKGQFEWMAGAGLQLRAISVWGLYSFDKERFEFAFGLSDISWLKYVMPYVK